ncbi:MAG: thiamine-phosphate kinase [Vicinamibacterales bacterium]
MTTDPLDDQTVQTAGEHALIARIVARLPRPGWLAVAAGDDAAVTAPVPREHEVLTTDTLVEGVHFDRRFCSPGDIGHKALAVNLSDLAAMGARPRSALLSLVLPDALRVADLDALVDGLLAAAATYRIAVVGGNVTRSAAPGPDGAPVPGGGPLIVTVTAIGSVPPRRVLTRTGARPGDDVYVTGSLGAGRAGLLSLRADPAAEGEAERRYRRPAPRVRAGMLLGRYKAATACIDLSDGLADGVKQICAASGAGMLIDSSLVPVDSGAAAWCASTGRGPQGAAPAGTALELALAGGDDYELLFTVRPSARGRLRGVRRALGDLPITRIGTVIRDRRQAVLVDGHERPIPDGFEHFR